MTGAMTDPLAGPRFQPAASAYSSMWAFVKPASRSVLRISSDAARDSGLPVTRPPTVSVSVSRKEMAPRRFSAAPTDAIRGVLRLRSRAEGHESRSHETGCLGHVRPLVRRLIPIVAIQRRGSQPSCSRSRHALDHAGDHLDEGAVAPSGARHRRQAAILENYKIERQGRPRFGPSVVQNAQVAKRAGRDPFGFPNHVAALCWSGRQDLNLRPPGPEPGALPG